MNRFLGILMLVLLTACDGPEASSSDQDYKSAILEVMDLQVEAWNSGDVAAYMEGYWRSDSLRFIGRKSVTYGWEATLARYKKAYPDQLSMGHLDFSELELKLVGENHAYVVGQWQLARTNDTLSGRFSLLWQHFDHGWKIVSDHSS